MPMIPTIPTCKSVTVLPWDDFVNTISNSDVCLEDAPTIDKMWDRAQEGVAFVLSPKEEDLFNNLQQNVA